MVLYGRIWLKKCSILIFGLRSRRLQTIYFLKIMFSSMNTFITSLSDFIENHYFNMVRLKSGNMRIHVSSYVKSSSTCPPPPALLHRPSSTWPHRRSYHSRCLTACTAFLGYQDNTNTSQIPALTSVQLLVTGPLGLITMMLARSKIKQGYIVNALDIFVLSLFCSWFLAQIMKYEWHRN